MGVGNWIAVASAAIAFFELHQSSAAGSLIT